MKIYRGIDGRINDLFIITLHDGPHFWFHKGHVLPYDTTWDGDLNFIESCPKELFAITGQKVGVIVAAGRLKVKR